MVRYNTFVAQQTKGGKVLLVTSSARKAKRLLAPGVRVEVWNENQKTETIYTRTSEKFDSYVAAEREYIRNKQEAAERRNRQRRAYRDNKT